ncbi:NUDIX domain-containing protein [Kribbella sp. NPDC049584]|uniref:NUDIX domain-containing protein n=1 Tax=Kribbella sp. NPDC049584 TaxID=3154833 RepID=UPI0034352C29
MTLRTTRHLTSVFLLHQGSVLLLYRRGSRAIADSWVGIGGHVEAGELDNPTGAALRELHEEVGVAADHLDNFSLRYVAMRDTGTEVRTTYYFTADLRTGSPIPTECTEGDLRWFELTTDPSTLEMPPTAAVAFAHWLGEGRHDEQLRFIVLDADGHVTGPG